MAASDFDGSRRARRDRPAKRAFPSGARKAMRPHDSVAVEFEGRRPQPLDGRTLALRGSSLSVPTRARSTPSRRVDAHRRAGRWRYPGQLTEMHPSEGEGYWLNINSPDPRAFVMWRMREGDGEPPAFPVVVTLSYNQAARMMDGGEQVDSVPLDPRIRAMLEPYTAEHYKPEVRKKHKRNDPFKEGAFVRDRDRGGEPTE
jgi:hypothetical protein